MKTWILVVMVMSQAQDWHITTTPMNEPQCKVIATQLNHLIDPPGRTPHAFCVTSEGERWSSPVANPSTNSPPP